MDVGFLFIISYTYHPIHYAPQQRNKRHADSLAIGGAYLARFRHSVGSDYFHLAGRQPPWNSISIIRNHRVVLTAKGKLAAYYFGIINCVLYSIISYNQTLYGETILNLVYYLPLQFVGFRIWQRYMDTEQSVVKPIRFSNMLRLYLMGAIIVCTFVLGWILNLCGDEIPYIDAFTTVASVLAMTLSARRNVEQWYLWISINVFSIYMWIERFQVNGENIATLLMWVTYFFNSLYGLYKWTRK